MSRDCVRPMSRRSGCSAARPSSTTWRRCTGCATIIEKGPAWFAGHGRNGRKGLRSFSVSGRVKKPGVHLAPAGITLQELIDEYCGGMLDGHTLYGYLPGGASGGILPASMANVPLDFDTLTPYGCFIGSAAVVVLSDKDTATAAARNVMKFFADESCGQCTPCRVGTEKALHLMNERRWDQAAAAGAVAGDDGRLDLRAGSGGAESGADCAEVFPGKSSNAIMIRTPAGPEDRRCSEASHRCSRRQTLVTFTLNGQTIVGAAPIRPSSRPRTTTASRSRASATWRACARTATAARAWSRSRANACWRRRAAAIRRTGWRSRPNSARAITSQKMSIELLLSDVPETSYTLNSELDLWARKMGVGKPRFGARPQPVEDLSHPAMAVHLDACIQCKRCVRACREEQVNDVIGYAFRGGQSKIVFDLDDPMGNSTCVACGECVQACPTGALMPARDVAMVVPDKTVDSVCPYCGVGCQLTYNVKDNRILFVQGKDGPANSSRLCVKGRYGFDYVQHRHRLTTPLIRKPGVAEAQGLHRRSGEVARGVPRGDVGGSARRRGKGPARHPRHVRQACARRLRVSEGHQRRGVSVPEAGAHRLRVQQRRPLHAPLPRVERRRAHGGHQLRRRVEPGARRRQRRSDLRHRRQPDDESSGRGDVDQERRQGGRQADRRRPAPQRSRAPRDL